MYKRVITIIFAAAFVFTSALLPAYAEDHPMMEHGSPSGAAVSEEVDRASGSDNDLATQYFMYIPPKLNAEDVPKMGDAGIDINTLLLVTISVGVIYLGCHYLAYRDS